MVGIVRERKAIFESKKFQDLSCTISIHQSWKVEKVTMTIQNIYRLFLKYFWNYIIPCLCCALLLLVFLSLKTSANNWKDQKKKFVETCHFRSRNFIANLLLSLTAIVNSFNHIFGLTTCIFDFKFLRISLPSTCSRNSRNASHLGIWSHLLMSISEAANCAIPSKTFDC